MLNSPVVTLKHFLVKVVARHSNLAKGIFTFSTPTAAESAFYRLSQNICESTTE